MKPTNQPAHASINQNPYPLLLSNRSKRPRTLPSFLIIFQHSLDLEVRFRAANPLFNGSNDFSQHSRIKPSTNPKKFLQDKRNDEKMLKEREKTRDIYKRAGVLEPREAARLDSTGLLWLRKTFGELNEQYGGNFIFIQACGNLISQVPGKEYQNYSSFYKNGRIVDICSDPLGWDSDSDDDLKEESEKKNNSNVILSRIDNLEDIFQAVKKAALSIQSGKNTNYEQVGTDSTKILQTNEIETAATSVSSQPIPIFFDSLQPILIMHGIRHTVSFLQLLRTYHHVPFEFHLKRSTNVQTELPTPLPQLSPIITPTLTNSLHSSHHRQLEDIADAIAHLHDGQLNIVKKSHRGTGKITSENQSFVMEYGTLHGNEKLHKSIIGALPEINFTTNADSFVKDEHLNKDEKWNEANEASADGGGTTNIPDLTFKLGQLTAQEEAMRMATVLPHHHKQSQRNRIHLKMEDEKGTGDNEGLLRNAQNQKNPKGPRIFLEDDDPEFDDMDEEDPDDDLDL